MDVTQEFNDTFAVKARALEQAHRQAVQEMRESPIFNQEFKDKQLARLEAQRVQDVQALQAHADSWIKATRNKLAKEAQAVHTAQVDRLRKTLGDSGAIDVLRRNVESWTPQQIAEAYKGAASEWEKTVLCEYGALSLRGRERTPNVIMALDALQEEDAEASVRQELRTLDSSAHLVAQLDIRGYSADVAPRLGVSAEAMARVMAGE